MTQARYLYSELASAVQARKNCILSNNDEWLNRWSARIGKLSERLPHGAGFDQDSKVDIDASHADKLVIRTAFHHMNEAGFYDGWTEHTVTITPAFSGINIRVSGRNRNEIKDYIADTFSELATLDVSDVAH